jgi:hypothetical protein
MTAARHFDREGCCVPGGQVLGAGRPDPLPEYMGNQRSETQWPGGRRLSASSGVPSGGW